jgi:thiol-disulfide isomerase/thioredoxin
MTVTDLQPGVVRAGELYGDFWFNAEPTSISALRGQVILIHFWDYTCVHCHRTLPYLREWWKKYRDFGLVVIGVHTPKFPFGRDPGEVQRAIERLEIAHPVVMDNESLIAGRYGSRAWPSLYLVDRNGFVRLQSIGEGEYGSIEHAIQSLLYDAGVDRDLPLPMGAIRAEDRPGAMCYRATPELFTGYTRGTLGNVEGYTPESAVEYRDPEIYIDGRFYADGIWMNDRNSVRFAGEPGQSGHLMLLYRAAEVSAVIKPEGRHPCEVEVRQDDRPVSEADSGTDLRRRPDGRSYVVVDEARSYHLLKNREFGEHVLRLTTSNRGCSVYSFIFVSCVIPELIPTN